MTNYLNFYYKDKIIFFTRNKKIKFRVIDNRFKYIKNYIDLICKKIFKKILMQFLLFVIFLFFINYIN